MSGSGWSASFPSVLLERAGKGTSLQGKVTLGIQRILNQTRIPFYFDVDV